MGLLILEDILTKLRGQAVYIPLYQRNYRWPANEIQGSPISARKLIADIVSHMPESDFLLGMITVYMDKDGNIQILDGQQRLITLSLIARALNNGRVDTDTWIDLEFERDPGFSFPGGKTPRRDFLLGHEADDITDYVDVVRMKNNYSVIKAFIDECGAAPGEILKFMLGHIRLFLHETKREPIDEFLNINFKKTPFCSADYIKSYMILDAAGGSNTEAVSVPDIMDLWGSIEYDLYQLNELTAENEGLTENDMFMLIKDGYKHLEKSRMEILFEDRYYDEKGTLVKEKYYEKNDDSVKRLKEQYDELFRFHKLMQELLQELIVIDKDGNRHPNCTAYGAFRQLRKEKSDLTFFKLFDTSKGGTIQSELYKEYHHDHGNNLEMRSYENIDHKQAQTVNRFMNSMLATTPGGGSEADFFSCDGIDPDDFNGYKKIFDKSFTEFVGIIEKGKKEGTVIACKPAAMAEKRSGCQESPVKTTTLEQKPYTLENLFTDPGIRQIKIPRIQRDYVMGGSEEYLKQYLLRIRNEELNCSSQKHMNASCIMGHLDEQGVFWVYDGQQRITTLLLFLLYALNEYGSGEDSPRDIRKCLEKFVFEDRSGANSILKTLINSPFAEEATIRGFIDDQSSYSMYRMWKLLNDHSKKESDPDKFMKSVHPLFIWKGMDFEVVSLDRVDDAEHMFIELNEGLRLDETEEYKATLCHIMKNMGYEKEKEVSVKIDNEWLNCWQSEKTEVDYLQACVWCAYSEDKGYDKDRDMKSLKNTDPGVLDIATAAMDALVRNKEAAADLPLRPWWTKLLELTDPSCFKPLTCGFKNSDNTDCIYFSPDGFNRLIDLYSVFVPGSTADLFFRHMRDLRKNGFIPIGNEKDLPSKDMSISTSMLKSRRDGFKYSNNAGKWEELWKKGRGAGYDGALIESAYSLGVVEGAADDSFGKHKAGPGDNTYSLEKLEKYPIFLYKKCGFDDQENREKLRSFIMRYVVQNIDAQITGWTVGFAVCQSKLYPAEYKKITDALTKRYIKNHTGKDITFSEEFGSLIRGELSKEDADTVLEKLKKF